MRHRLLHTFFYVTMTALFHRAVDAADSRFVPLDQAGRPLSTQERQQWGEWPCVFDSATGLLWEGKSRAAGLHNRQNTYHWFNPTPAINGGLAGEPGGRDCRDGAQQLACDTQGFVEAVNREGLCQLRDWRLPHREELRSLVDYRIPYPGPTIDTQAFPNAIAQFYWSADTNASDPSEAWGIGFAFGFDYAYFKSNRVPVRLVSSSRQLREHAEK